LRPIEVAEGLIRAAGVPGELLVLLRQINQDQWDLEDLTRAASASNYDIALAKRNIDASNSRRHRIIDFIDSRAVVTVCDTGPATWYSETIGELCDRLVILDLKARALQCIASLDSDDRLAATENACEHLAEVATRLAADIKAQRAALPPRLGVKVYNGQWDAVTVIPAVQGGT
jgi:hypothetical protein